MRSLLNQRYLAVFLAALFIVVPFYGFAGAQAEAAAEVDADVWTENQAPALAALVERGELPPLDQRIPVNPRVVTPLDEIGRYGGEARSALIGAADAAWLGRTVNYEGIVLWDKNWTEVLPGAAARFEISEDGRTFTFELRDGLRWHDGERFTSADVEWWYYHEASNELLSPVPPSLFHVGDGQLAELTIIDDLTFSFTFPNPQPFFLDQLASGWYPTAQHYGEQFHADFNPDIEAVAEAEGFANWMDYYGHHIQDGSNWNAELPSIRAWTPVAGQGYTGETTRVRYERNPYYYAVDTDGNQLPYIDSWVFNILESSEVLLFRTIAGEVDFLYRHINSIENKPVLVENMDRGNYRFFDTVVTQTSILGIYPNLTHDDEVFREIIRNRDFRIGLSYAIDREEISDLIFAGTVEPTQPAPHDVMPWYHERLAKQYTDFNRDLANEHFDRAGFPLDEAGRRIGPDGRPISFSVDVTDGHRDEWVDIMELVQQYWAAVGIDLRLNVIARSLFWERKDTNQHHANVWYTTDGLRDGPMRPRDWVPYHGNSFHAPRWAAYYGAASVLNAGTRPETPPDVVLRLFEIYDQLTQTADPAEQQRLFTQILDINAEEFFLIGTVRMPPGYGIVHNRIGNAPERMPSSVHHQTPAPSGPWQFFIRE